jgi:hypothetical protein
MKQMEAIASPPILHKMRSLAPFIANYLKDTFFLARRIISSESP